MGNRNHYPGFHRLANLQAVKSHARRPAAARLRISVRVPLAPITSGLGPPGFR